MKQLPSVVRAMLLAGVIFQQVSHAAETTAEEAAIRQPANEFVAAYDRGDADAVAAQWTDDGEYKLGHESVKGRAAIAALYKDFFKAHPHSKMTVKVDSIRVIAPAVALEEGTARMSQKLVRFPGLRTRCSSSH